MSDRPTLDDARRLLDASQALLDRAVASARDLTQGGRAIDDHQVLTERVAYAATEAVAVARARRPRFMPGPARSARAFLDAHVDRRWFRSAGRRAADALELFLAGRAP